MVQRRLVTAFAEIEEGLAGQFTLFCVFRQFPDRHFAKSRTHHIIRDPSGLQGNPRIPPCRLTTVSHLGEFA